MLSSVGSQGSIYDLIDQYMALEKIPRNKLVARKDGLNEKKNVFSELDSVLSALKTKLSTFTDVVVNPFFAKSSSSSDNAKIDITATGSAVSGNHTISIERLAKADTRVSNQFTDSGSSFGAFTTDQTFSIFVGHPTDTDPDNRVQVDVTVAASVFSGTDDEVLAGISDAINTAMGQAVADETIDGDEVVHSNVVNEQTGLSRLVLGSEQTGYTYRMDFGASSLLDTLGVNAAVASSGTSGGYITEIGTSRADSLLNSKFTMDGLTFYRDSNVVDDALNGVTLKLLDTFATPETVTIQTDVTAVRGQVDEFIEKYNDVIKFIREKTKTDPDTHERGALANDYFYGGMVSELRRITGSAVSGTTSSEYTLLYNIGIEANEDGTLSVKDSDKFTSALEANALYVSDLFNSDNGIAVQLTDYVDQFLSAGGSIASSKKQIDSQISSLNDRISYMDEILDKKEKRYFDQFTSLQETMYKLQSQQDFFSSFLG